MVTSMKPMLKVLLAVLVVGLWSSPASAQVSKARPQFEFVKDRAERLNGLSGRRATEEQNILLATKQLREVCISANASLANLFEPLASAASGEHETRLKEPSKLARNLANQLVGNDNLIARCTAVIDLIETAALNRPADFDGRLDFAMTKVIVAANARVNDWVDLTKKSEETLKWLRESLQEAHARRDNPAKQLAALDATRSRLGTKKLEQDREVRRLIGFWSECESHELDAYKKLNEAITAQNEAWLAPASPSQTEKVKAAYQTRLAAEDAHDAAHVRSGYAFLNVVKAQSEQHARDKEYAKSGEEVRKFLREANPETIAKRLNDFDRWTKLLEEELKR